MLAVLCFCYCCLWRLLLGSCVIWCLFDLFIRVGVLCLVLSRFCFIANLVACLQFGLAARRLCWFALRWCLFSVGGTWLLASGMNVLIVLI